jgi:hypothetical protein
MTEDNRRGYKVGDSVVILKGSFTNRVGALIRNFTNSTGWEVQIDGHHSMEFYESEFEPAPKKTL